ncbi:MAG TPA: NosD domain-containing protein [Acidimicrobiales bacterium]|nr:NosD domain-containing protein [Acidimicrobiales bacterium]
MRPRLIRTVVPAIVLLGGVIASQAGVAGAATPRVNTLWVAPVATTSKTAACQTAAYHEINPAIAAASSGDTVMVCAGTYTGFTTITTGVAQQPTITTGAEIDKSIRLIGQPGAIIDATGLDNGVTFFVATEATVRGFAITGAMGEGILALLSSHLTIADNLVKNNDTGSSTSPWFECDNAGSTIPNDCGEGIHLMSSTYSKVLDDTSEFNSGGILLSDDLGPNHGNTVSGNLVVDNESDCGITVVGHLGTAVSKSGVPTPAKGGTYENTISDNIVISNGTTGEGGGILLASGASGGGSYDNTVTGNEIAGNGLSGITIHQHFPLSDVSGDVFTNNWIGTNDLTGDPGTGDSVTTGVLVDNGGTGKTISVTVEDNTIAWDVYGIYDDAPGITRAGNVFLHVLVHFKK